MKKVAIFAFNGNLMCFVHVLLNALDMHSKNIETKVIIEGEAVKLVKELVESNNPLFQKARDNNLIAGVCKACSNKMGVLDFNTSTGIPLLDDMSGHPAIQPYMEQGYSIVTL